MPANERKQFIERMYQTFWKELYVVAYRRLRSEEDVEDILQDIFLSLLTGKQTLETDAAVRALLHQRLKSRIINHYRRQMIQITFTSEETRKDGLSDVDSESRLMNSELEEIVQKEIGRMPEKMKEIFLLSRNDLMSSEEIAAKLNLSRQTVRNQISTAIKRIKIALETYRNADLSSASFHIILTLGAYLLSQH